MKIEHTGIVDDSGNAKVFISGKERWLNSYGLELLAQGRLDENGMLIIKQDTWDEFINQIRQEGLYERSAT